jgi:hypothetical protein
VWPRLRTGEGESNEITVQRPGGDVGKLTITVRELRLGDVVYSEGGVLALGFLFFMVGAITFQLRPWAPESWALLALCTVGGGFLSMILSGVGQAQAPYAIYYRIMLGLLAAVRSTGLAFGRPPALLAPRVLYWTTGSGRPRGRADAGWRPSSRARPAPASSTRASARGDALLRRRCAALAMHTGIRWWPSARGSCWAACCWAARCRRSCASCRRPPACTCPTSESRTGRCRSCCSRWRARRCATSS